MALVLTQKEVSDLYGTYGVNVIIFGADLSQFYTELIIF